MWRKYANNDKGFCLHFEMDYDPDFFKDITRVSYADELPAINLLSIDLPEQMKILSTTKRKKFRIENEYRLLKHSSGLHQYKRGCLTGLTFGAFNKNPQELINVLRDYYNAKIEIV